MPGDGSPIKVSLLVLVRARQQLSNPIVTLLVRERQSTAFDGKYSKRLGFGALLFDDTRQGVPRWSRVPT
jgi:hypothetical protein